MVNESLKLRIIQYTPFWHGSKGGPSTYVKKFVEELRKHHKVFIITSDIGEGAILIKNQKSLNEILKILSQFKKIRPNVIHIHGRARVILPALIYKYLFDSKVKIIFTFHTAPHFQNFLSNDTIIKSGGYYGKRGKLIARLLKHVDIVTSVSGNIIMDLNKYFRMGINEYNIIPSGGEEPSVRMDVVDVVKNKYSLHKKSPVIFSIGVLSWDWKVAGHILAVKALKILLQDYKNSILLIAGDGQYREILEEAIKKEGMTDKVILLGNINFVNECLHLSDIYLHTGLNEGCPLSIIEGMWSSKPIVAVDKGGVNEILSKGAGHLVKSSPEEIARGLRTLLTDRNIMDAYAFKALEIAENDYSWTKITKQYLTLYK